MNRNYYCKVDSQEELDYLEKSILNLKEPFTSEFKYSYNDEWQYFGWKSDYEEWSLAPLGHLPEDKIEVPYSEFIDWVTGKLPEGKEEEEILEKPKVAPKFEAGKWYKINNYWYAKHECIHGSGRYWRHSDRITIHGNFYDELGDLGDNWKDVSIVLLEDLSEIQQYLPDGHPDKFTTSIAKEDLDKYDDEGNLIEGKEYPEYVETVDWNGEYCKNGEIYKVLNGKVQTPHTILDIYYSDHKECFKPSTKSAYDVQFKKGEQFKDGDWLVYIKHCETNTSIPIKIGDIKQMIKGKFGSLVIYGYEDLSQYFRKALPHEIPVENSVKINSYNISEFNKKIASYLLGVTSISELKTTLSIDDEDLPMVIPSKEVKITNKLSID